MGVLSSTIGSGDEVLFPSAAASLISEEQLLTIERLVDAQLQADALTDLLTGTQTHPSSPFSSKRTHSRKKKTAHSQLCDNAETGTEHTSRCVGGVPISVLRDEARDAFLHAYDSYIKFGFPFDEVKPISCEPRCSMYFADCVSSDVFDPCSLLYAHWARLMLPSFDKKMHYCRSEVQSVVELNGNLASMSSDCHSCIISDDKVMYMCVHV
jgi:hypothetical protein